MIQTRTTDTKKGGDQMKKSFRLGDVVITPSGRGVIVKLDNPHVFVRLERENVVWGWHSAEVELWEEPAETPAHT